MPAARVPWDVPRGDGGLSKHGDPMFPHFCTRTWAHARTRGVTDGGDMWRVGPRSRPEGEGEEGERQDRDVDSVRASVGKEAYDGQGGGGGKA